MKLAKFSLLIMTIILFVSTGCYIGDDNELNADTDDINLVLTNGNLISTDEYDEINPKLLELNTTDGKKTILIYASNNPNLPAYDSGGGFKLYGCVLSDDGIAFNNPEAIEDLYPAENSDGEIEENLTPNNSSDSIRYYTIVDRTNINTLSYENVDDATFNDYYEEYAIYNYYPLVYYTNEASDDTNIISVYNGIYSYEIYSPFNITDNRDGRSFDYIQGYVLGHKVIKYHSDGETIAFDYTESSLTGDGTGDNSEGTVVNDGAGGADTNSSEDDLAILLLCVKMTDSSGFSDVSAGDVVVFFINISSEPGLIWDYYILANNVGDNFHSGSIFDPTEFEVPVLMPGLVYSAGSSEDVSLDFYFLPIGTDTQFDPIKLSAFSSTGNDIFPSFGRDGNLYFSSDVYMRETFPLEKPSYDLYRWKHKEWSDIDIPNLSGNVVMPDLFGDERPDSVILSVSDAGFNAYFNTISDFNINVYVNATIETPVGIYQMWIEIDSSIGTRKIPLYSFYQDSNDSTGTTYILNGYWDVGPYNIADYNITLVQAQQIAANIGEISQLSVTLYIKDAWGTVSSFEIALPNLYLG